MRRDDCQHHRPTVLALLETRNGGLTMEPSYEEVLDDTIWNHFTETLRIEAAVRRLLIAAETCQDELAQANPARG